MNCSSAIDGLDLVVTEGDLSKASGAYTFTKSSTTQNGNQTITVGTNRWDSVVRTASTFNT